MKLKKLLLCSIILLHVTVNFAQIQWTWMKGNSSANQPGAYGTIGNANINNVPGSRQGSVTWTDNSGNMWLFGGTGFDGNFTIGQLNDLWKYNPVNNKWMWVSGNNMKNQPGFYGSMGVGSTANIPGSRYNSVSWVDASGDLWLFGGAVSSMIANGIYNDIWKYSISTNEWTWVNGSIGTNTNSAYGTKGVGSTTNTPGARQGATSWVDASGNFWLFGGIGYDSNANNSYLNDLWKYNPSNNQWTWVSGSNTNSQLGAYGTLGVASATNVPGARYKAKNFKDAAGNLWLFGGSGFAASGTADLLNDLWKYNISTNQWTWVSGSNAINQTGAYGTLGVASATNIPGARDQAVGWEDASGNFMLWGGNANTTLSNAFSDLWKYDPIANQWTWLNGPNGINQSGAYGTQGVASATNIPGARYLAVSAKDISGNMWLFGGFGADNTTSQGYLNDSWRISTSCVAPAAPTDASLPANLSICSGNHATLTASGSGTLKWYSTASSTTTLAVGPSYITNALGAGGSPYTFYVEANTCTTSATRTPITVTVNALPIISVNSGTICAGSSFTMVPGGASTYTFSSGSAIVSPITTTNYSVSGTSTAGCLSLLYAVSHVTVMPSPTVTASSNATSICVGQSATLTAGGAATYIWNTGVTTTTVGVSPLVTTNYIVTGYGSNGCGNTKTVSIVVNTVNIAANSSTICIGSSTIVTANGASSYSWNTGATTPSISVSPTITTNYIVTGTNTGCTDTKTVTVTVSLCTGINQLTNSIGALSIYPNPTNDVLFIESESLPENSIVEINNSLGQKVSVQELNNSTSSITLANLNNGVYYLRIINNNLVIHQAKIIKQD